MATDITEPRIENADELAKRFAQLVSTWRERTAFSSKIKTRIEHPAFREIVAMGEPAIPHILADLEKNGGFGFLALAEITGANPIPENCHVNNDEWAAAWLAWGRENGFRWEHAV